MNNGSENLGKKWAVMASTFLIGASSGIIGLGVIYAISRKNDHHCKNFSLKNHDDDGISVSQRMSDACKKYFLQQKDRLKTAALLYLATQLKNKNSAILLPVLYLLFNNEDKASQDDESMRPRDIIHREPIEEIVEDNPSNHNRESSNTLFRKRSDSIMTQTSEVSIGTQDENSPRYLEMLVHNVSHTDMVLSLGIPESLQAHQIDETKEDSYQTPKKGNHSSFEEKRCSNQIVGNGLKEEAHAICRPRFSAFDMYCKRILQVFRPFAKQEMVSTSESQASLRPLYSCIMQFPQYERSDSTSRFSLVTPKPSKQAMVPVGFNLSQLQKETNIDRKVLQLSEDDIASLRIRGRDMQKMEGVVAAGCWQSLSQNLNSSQPPKISTEFLHLDGIFFPLLSNLLRQWHKQIAGKYKYKADVKKVLVLVTGVGTPRNWTHSKDGNSTEVCAELMEYFIKILYPDVVVVKLHSKQEIFRYDENISFANEELLPCIEGYRDAHARGEPYPDEIDPTKEHNEARQMHFNPDWKQSFFVTYSFADGAQARTYAIQSALRPFRPTYYHHWQLKSFWHNMKISNDIEVHSFESMETVPAMDVSRTNFDVQNVVKEIKVFRGEFLESLEDDNDIKKFWLRKTKKPVLAVLLVNHPKKGKVLYRGTNMEVSMPTGSLCAERNVIGTALALNPGLRREDILMVAVLAVPISNNPQITTKAPALQPKESNKQEVKFTFFEDVEDKLKKYQRPENYRRSMSVSSFASIVEKSDSNETDDSWDQVSGGSKSIIESPPISKSTNNTSGTLASPSSIPQLNIEDKNSGISTPVRKIKLYDLDSNNATTGVQIDNKRRTITVYSAEDINPLKPCGACNEWLKKIAESNPYFKVVTFTDSACNGIYCAPCHE